MRLAEFKMRLLVFFAGTLRQWAGTIEPTAEEPTRRKNAVDDDGAVPPESRRESGAASGPPEHWTRLVATAPPEHWLDLIREKAPHLLSNNENESVSTSADETSLVTPRETLLAPETPLSSESGTAEGSTTQPRSRRRSDPADTEAPVSGAKWLRRLRVQPSKQRPPTEQIEQPAYPTRNSGETRKSPDYHDSRNSERGSEEYESRLHLPDESTQGREPPRVHQPDRSTPTQDSAKLAYDCGDEAHEAHGRRGDGTGTTAGEPGRPPLR